VRVNIITAENMGKKHKKHKSERYSAEGTEKMPIKLILKLGSEGTYDSDYPPNSPSHSHKRKKKKKHSSDHSSEKVIEPIQPEDVKIVEVYSTQEESSHTAESDMEQDVAVEEPVETPVIKISLTQSQRKALNVVLHHLLKQLEKKDPNEVFKWPVTDVIAPGYSSLITHPMDFSTMRNKINTNQYFTLLDMKQDFEQMIENCCTYNNEDTVYYQLAKRLLTAGSKIFSKERLISMLKTLSTTGVLPESEIDDIIGLCGVEKVSINITRIEQDAELMDLSSKPLASDVTGDDVEKAAEHEPVSFTDQDDALSVAPNAAEAAKEAREKLEKRGNVGNLGYLNMDEDGKCTMTILNPDHCQQDVRTVDLGVLTGSLQSGVDVMAEVKEDKRNKVTPLEYLSYGPFGSFAPTYDSRIANLTAEESEMLLSAYNGETEHLFAQSMQDFVGGCNSTFVTMVEDLLDNVTHGEHSRVTNEIFQKRKLASAKESVAKPKVPKVDFDQLRTLKELGIDVSFVDAIEKEFSQDKMQDVDVVSSSLDRGSALLHKLKGEQMKRLSVKAENKEPNLAGPTKNEKDTASELQQTLASLASSAGPGSLVSDAALHKAMRVDL